MQKVDTRRLLQRQSSFVEGESVGKMLAQLVKSNSPPSTILTIRSTGGEIISNTTKIVQIFRDYYKNLYTAQKKGVEGVMEDFLGHLEIPAITQEERDELETPITLMELQQAVVSMANQKSIVEVFGSLTGLEINWEESELLPIDPISDLIIPGIPQLAVVDTLK